MITHLKEGDKAPLFTSTDQDGNKIALRNFKGKKVALFFYPKDNTPACTKQACNVRDHYSELLKYDIIPLGISPDDENSHTKFRTKFNLPFTLITDTRKKIANKYGVWGEKKFMGRIIIGIHRTTFLINEKGKIIHIIKRVITKDHVRQILEGFEINGS